MSKIRYFSNKFLQIAKRWGRPHRPLSFDFGYLKLRDLLKLRGFSN